MYQLWPLLKIYIFTHIGMCVCLLLKPSLKIIGNDDFMCISCDFVFFIQPHFHDSQIYLARFRRCLSRALSFIKQHVVTTLKNATRSVLPNQVSVNLCLLPKNWQQCSFDR